MFIAYARRARAFCCESCCLRVSDWYALLNNVLFFILNEFRFADAIDNSAAAAAAAKYVYT